MGDTLTFDLVARDKSVTQAFNQAAKAGDQLASKLDSSGKKIASGMEASFKKAGKSGVYLERTADGVIKAWDQAGQRMDRSFESATKAIGADLDRVERDAWESGAGISKAFATSLKASRSELDRLRVEGARTGAGLESSLGQSLRSVKQDAAKMGSSIKSDLKQVEKAGKEAGEGIGSSLSEGMSSVFDRVGGGGALSGLTESLTSGKAMLGALGLALGGLLMDGISNAIQQRQVGALVAAQTGQAAGASARMGNIAGNVFADNFGQSIEDVGAAMAAVFQNKLIDTSSADDAIQHITEQIITVSDVMGEEASEVSRAAHAMLVNGVARNVTEALDLIQHGTESGLNTAGDFIDTITEYSSMFHKVGLNGQESFGLLSQAIKGGARDTDYAADAIKEFQVRAQDGSVLTARGFRSLGLDAKKMGDMVAAGGAPAKQALREVLNALQGMPPSVERSTAAVDLFGTKAEDLGDALYHMDLDNAAAQFGDFAGSVQDATNRLSEGQTTWSKVGKGVGQLFTDIGEGINNLPGGSLSEALPMDELMAAKQQFMATGETTWFDELKEKMPSAAGAIDGWIAQLEKERGAEASSAAAVQQHVDTLDELIAKQQEVAGITLGVREAESAYQAAIDNATASIQKNGKAHGFNTEKGRENNAALDDIAKTALTVAASMAADGRSTDAVNKKMGAARAQFMSTARSMGYTKGEAQALATKLGLIRGNYKAQVRALGIAAAKSSVQSLINRLDNIPRSVNVMVNVHGNEMAARGIPTGGFQRRAAGGPVKAHQLYRVGEQGEEWFVPNRDGVIIPHGAARSTAAMLSPHGSGGQPAGKSPIVLQVLFSGSSSMAEAFKADVRTGKIKLRADGAAVTVG